VRATLQVHTHGQWRTLRRLRFRHDSRTLRPVVRFRGNAPARPTACACECPRRGALPYASGTSRPVTVLVRR